MAKRTSAAVDRLRAGLVADDEAKQSQCSQARQDDYLATQLEEAWQAVQSSGDAKSVMRLADLLKEFEFEERIQRVQSRAIAFAEAVEQEPSGDWRYPGLSTSSATIKHATTMIALTAILLDAIAGRKPGTITKALNGLKWWERGPSWEMLRGEMLFFDHFPVEAICNNPKAVLIDEDWGSIGDKLHHELKSWQKVFIKAREMGYPKGDSMLRTLVYRYRETQKSS